MKVTITHEEVTETLEPKPSILNVFKAPPTRQAYRVYVKLELSKEESAIANNRNLWTTVVYKRQWTREAFEGIPHKYRHLARDMPSEIPVTLEQLVKGNKQRRSILNRVTSAFGGKDKKPFALVFYTPAAASSFEAQLESEILPNVKEILQANARAPKGARSFEL